jgi:phage tail sheath protein FI
VYVPWLVLKDGSAVAPSGAIAGVMARVDGRRGVWKAPAGTEAQVEGVGGLSHPFADAAHAGLNREGINVVRGFPGRGHLVWGARTLAGRDSLASDWKYINVRRLGLYIERSIDEGTPWAASEPNAEALWADLRRVITEFMNGLFRAGAFAGRTDREAWFVKCDRQTTTQDDINAGKVQVIVGFAPLKPAEFVILQFAVRAKRPDED